MMCAQNFCARDTEENHQDYDDDHVGNTANGDDDVINDNNYLDNAANDDSEKKCANEAPTYLMMMMMRRMLMMMMKVLMMRKVQTKRPHLSRQTNWLELRSTFGHQTDQTRPDCNESQIQRQNMNNTNTKRRYEYKYKMNEVDKLLQSIRHLDQTLMSHN